jgi:hypothetical protein
MQGESKQVTDPGRAKTLWGELGKVIGARGTCPPAREAHFLTVMSQMDYLPVVLQQLAEHISEESDSREEWCGYVCYNRQVDVDQVILPGLLEYLGRFSQNGALGDLFSALALVTNLITRELLRRGKLPVMYPVGLVPSTPVSDITDPVVDSFSKFDGRQL